MQINNYSSSQRPYSPNFQCTIRYNLPTKEVLECVTGKISRDTLNNPNGLFKIFQELFNLTNKDIKELLNTPLALPLYKMASGTMIKENNPELKVLAKNILELPLSEQNKKINEVMDELGKFINVIIDDSIKEYKTVKGVTELSKTKRRPQ